MTEYNAGSRRHIREAEKDAKAAEGERKVVIASIMQHRGGRAWMLSVLEDCHVFASSFTNNALSTAFREGERNIGIKLLASIMEASPNNYTLMMREADERDRASEQRRGPESNGRTQGGPVGYDEPDDASTDDDAGSPDARNEVEYRA